MKIFYFESTVEAYAATQTRDDIEIGDVLVIKSERVVGIADTWPVAVTVECGQLHAFADGPISVDDFDFGFEQIEDAERIARNLGFDVRRPEAKPAQVLNESHEDALTYLCSDQEAQAFVDHYRAPEMGLHLCVEGGRVRIKAYSTADSSASMRAEARVARYIEIARCSLNRGRPPKVKRVRISKKFRDGGEGLLFASIYFCPTRNGYVFNTSMPGRRPGRKTWPTWQQAIPRWVRKQNLIHYSLVTEA